MTKIHLQNKLRTQTEGNEIVWVDDLWIDRPDIAKQLRFEQMFSRCKLFDRQVPLYQKQKPLTQEQIDVLCDAYLKCQEESPEMSGIYRLIRAVERAHGIGVKDEPDSSVT